MNKNIFYCFFRPAPIYLMREGVVASSGYFTDVIFLKKNKEKKIYSYSIN